MSNIVVRNNGTGTLSEGIVNNRAGVNVGPVRSISCEILQKRFKLQIAYPNVGTMRGRASEIVEILASRRINICAFFSFFFNLFSCISVVPAEEILLVCCDLNGHLEKIQVVLKVHMEGMAMEPEIQIQEIRYKSSRTMCCSRSSNN